ncbi:unnamed protein product, partial [Amoebophrya sp. A25]
APVDAPGPPHESPGPFLAPGSSGEDSSTDPRFLQVLDIQSQNVSIQAQLEDLEKRLKQLKAGDGDEAGLGNDAGDKTSSKSPKNKAGSGKGQKSKKSKAAAGEREG